MWIFRSSVFLRFVLCCFVFSLLRSLPPFLFLSLHSLSAEALSHVDASSATAANVCTSACQPNGLAFCESELIFFLILLLQRCCAVCLQFCEVKSEICIRIEVKSVQKSIDTGTKHQNIDRCRCCAWCGMCGYVRVKESAK